VADLIDMGKGKCRGYENEMFNCEAKPLTFHKLLLIKNLMLDVQELSSKVYTSQIPLIGSHIILQVPLIAFNIA
jgi:hypothetical protein